MKAYLATIRFCFWMCAVLGIIAVKIADTPLKLQHARKLPVTEWTVGKEIRLQEEKCNLPHGSIAAQVEHETIGTWDEKIFNPEKNSACYRRAKTEAERKRCGSRGLMQVVAYWHLKPNEDAKLLEDPIENVRRGAKKLCESYKKAKGDLRKAYELYNGTGPRARLYAQNVMIEFKYFSRMS